MSPLHRQQTHGSIYSWWSDNNLTGPNINLHAATKPLLRRMHDRQALALIRKNRGTPLSSKDVEICTSYLWFKDVSPSTKIAILRETYERADSEDDALTVAKSLALYHVDALLESPNDEFRSQTCMILARLACHETTVAAVLCINPCERLVSILQDDNIEVVQSGVYALHCLAEWREGAQALANAGVLECVKKLLGSGEARIRRWTCEMLARLLQQTPTLPAIADSVVKLFNQLALVLRAETRPSTALDLMESAALALFWSIRSSEAQEAILLDCLGLLESRNIEVHERTWKMLVDARVLDCTAELLDSPSPDVRRSTCRLLRQLAGHQTTMAAVLAISPCEQLVPCLHDQNLHVVESAAQALVSIASVPEGAQAALDKDVLQHVMELFKSPEAVVRKWTCFVVGQLSSHKTTLPVVLAVKPCTQLVSLLSDENLVVVEGAVVALYVISRSPEGALAAVNAHALDFVPELLKSSSARVRGWMCKMYWCSVLARPGQRSNVFDEIDSDGRLTGFDRVRPRGLTSPNVEGMVDSTV
ncbi:armadillo-type protein [Mycena vulgaris]|nr:armadillo-type protein [Mycena vulgaris]KAJ6545903.1 armadillo-type protein [Mycena vulgaris]